MHETDILFWRLIEEHRAPLWRFALGLTRSRDDANDLTTEAVLAAHESFPQLRDHQAFRKSLFTIAIRLHKRKVWRRRIFGNPEEAESAHYHDSHESSHDLDLLMQALSALPERQRETVLLFEITGLSLEEIRGIQGGTLSGVKARLVRGRQKLKEFMTEPEVAYESASPVRHETWGLTL